MRIQNAIRWVRAFFQKDPEAAPPPRWQIIVASVYLGMLLYLAVYRSGLLFH
jgi:hypothetical protein